jgi:hypothetical protein
MLLVLAACSAPAEDAPVQVRPTSTGVASTIYEGSRDEQPGSGAVVALKVPGEGATFELCTGAMIAENLVVTARHCVSRALATTVSCTQEGQSANGDHVAGDLEPRSIQIYTGATPTFSGSPAAYGRQIFRPAGAVLCNADIAVLMIDRPLAGFTPLAVRLEGGLRKGESIRSVGYGQNDRKLPTGTRLRKEGVGVLAVGKTISASKTPLGSHEFEVGVSICQGDSGGPAISETTGAVVGVVSRGGDCSEDFGHIYTTTSGFGEVFRAAFAAAGATPAIDPPPPAEETLGTTSAKSDGNVAEPAASGHACSAGRAGAPREGWIAGLAAAALLACARLRRRKRRRK